MPCVDINAHTFTHIHTHYLLSIPSTNNTVVRSLFVIDMNQIITIIAGVLVCELTHLVSTSSITHRHRVVNKLCTASGDSFDDDMNFYLDLLTGNPRFLYGVYF